MALFADDIAFKTIIGEGSSIHGDIKINGMVRIEGDIDGNIETTGNIFIGEKARIRGNIVAKSVTVCGVVCGNIIAPESVQLFATSTVIGDIQTHRLRADENVLIQGHCIALSNETEYTDASSQWDNTKAITSHAILEPIHLPEKSEQEKNEPKNKVAESEKTQESGLTFIPVSLGHRIR